MKKKQLIHCPECSSAEHPTRLEKAIQHEQWFYTTRKILHCPNCKFFKALDNESGHVDDETLVHILKIVAFVLGVLLILKGLFGCTPYY